MICSLSTSLGVGEESVNSLPRGVAPRRGHLLVRNALQLQGEVGRLIVVLGTHHLKLLLRVYDGCVE